MPAALLGELFTMNHDRLFKELIASFFIEFVDLLLPDLSPYIDRNAEIVQLDKELFNDLTEGESLIADLVMKLKFQGEDIFFLIHVESQAKVQRHFPRRMFIYFCRLSEKYNMLVYPVVVFSYKSAKRNEPDFYEVKFPNKRILRFDYTTIQFGQVPWRTFLSNDNPIAAALMSTMKMDKSERPLVKLECLRLLARLKLDPARSKLIGGFVDSYLNLTARELKQFEREREMLLPIEREETVALVSRWEKTGIEIGLMQGRQEGKEAGLLQGSERVVERQLRRRFGDLSLDLVSKLNQLTTDQIEDLGEALLDFASLDDLDRWLSIHEDPAL